MDEHCSSFTCALSEFCTDTLRQSPYHVYNKKLYFIKRVVLLIKVQSQLTDKVDCSRSCQQDSEYLSCMLMNTHLHLRRVWFWRSTHCTRGSLQHEYQRHSNST